MAKKTRLSENLEQQFGHRPLRGDETQRLKDMAEGYQRLEALRWPEKDFELYHSYFGFLTALKTKSVIEELHRYQILSVDEPLEIVELGAGTLGASMGAVDAVTELGGKVSRIQGIDVQETAFRWAKSKFSSALGSRVEYLRNPPKLEENAPRLVIAANFLIEIQQELRSNALMLWLEEQFEKCSGKSLFVFIEPAEFDFNQKFLELRDAWSKKIRVLLPCTHQKACPALSQKEWCHEDRLYEAPSAYWNMVHQLGFRQKSLSFSLLVLGKKPPRFEAHFARVVSDDVSGKGQCERWLCADGKRWKQSELLRHETEAKLSFYESLRGDVVDLRLFKDSRQPQ
jgi:hypothetical protein